MGVQASARVFFLRRDQMWLHVLSPSQTQRRPTCRDPHGQGTQKPNRFAPSEHQSNHITYRFSKMGRVNSPGKMGSQNGFDRSHGEKPNARCRSRLCLFAFLGCPSSAPPLEVFNDFGGLNSLKLPLNTKRLKGHGSKSRTPSEHSNPH